MSGQLGPRPRVLPQPQPAVTSNGRPGELMDGDFCRASRDGAETIPSLPDAEAEARRPK